MDDGILLCDSTICRLCAEENHNGSLLFPDSECKENLSELVNKYLPLKVEKDGKYPCTLCPGCTIQLEATKSFFDLIIDGQTKLRNILSTQNDNLKRQEKEKEEYENVFKSINPSSSLQTISVHDAGQEILMHFSVFADGPLFPPEHELTLRAEGLNKPRKKRGRPPKQPVPTVLEIPEEIKEPEEESDTEIDGKRRRRIKKPQRYSELIEGKELDRVFKEEGVLEEDEFLSDTEINQKLPVRDAKQNEIIGHLEDKNGEKLGQLVVNKQHKVKVKQTTESTVPEAPKEKYDCNICIKSFTSLNRLEAHKLVHKVQYHCSFKKCFESFDAKNLLEQHQLENGHTEADLVECLENYSQIEQKATFNTEQTLPSTSSNNEPELDITSIQEVNKKLFACDKCDKTFPTLTGYNTHLTTHSERDYACESCDKVFHHPSSLVYHRDAEHNNGRKFVCIKCKKTFKHKQLLMRHQLVHSNERPHNCKTCGASFKTRANLLNHMPMHTGEKKYYCVQCGQNFAHKTSLTLHLRWHNGQKPYECDICLKTFSQKGNLAEHRRIHTGEKPYCCSYCDRRFTTSSQYKLHIKRHTGERPWKCEYCGKTFLHKDTWKCHTRRHRNERPYQCQQCLRGFTEQWALKKHERLHTGEKPYVCDICNKSFSDSSNLAKHKKIHWNQKKVKTKTEKTISITAADGEGGPNRILYLTYDDNNGNEEQTETLVHIVDPLDVAAGDGKIDGALFTEETDILEQQRENAEISVDVQLQQLVDNDGNVMSLTTADGQQIKIVTVDDQSIQGLMPDGTLIPLNLTMQDGKPVISMDDVVCKSELVEVSKVSKPPPVNLLDETEDILDNNLQFISDNTLDTSKLQYLSSDQKENKLQFLTEHGQNVCFITTLDIDNTMNNHYINMQ